MKLGKGVFLFVAISSGAWAKSQAVNYPTFKIDFPDAPKKEPKKPGCADQAKPACKKQFEDYSRALAQYQVDVNVAAAQKASLIGKGFKFCPDEKDKAACNEHNDKQAYTDYRERNGFDQDCYAAEKSADRSKCLKAQKAIVDAKKKDAKADGKEKKAERVATKEDVERAVAAEQADCSELKDAALQSCTEKNKVLAQLPFQNCGNYDEGSEENAKCNADNQKLRAAFEPFDACGAKTTKAEKKSCQEAQDNKIAELFAAADPALQCLIIPSVTENVNPAITAANKQLAANCRKLQAKNIDNRCEDTRQDNQLACIDMELPEACRTFLDETARMDPLREALSKWSSNKSAQIGEAIGSGKVRSIIKAKPYAGECSEEQIEGLVSCVRAAHSAESCSQMDTNTYNSQ